MKLRSKPHDESYRPNRELLATILSFQPSHRYRSLAPAPEAATEDDVWRLVVEATIVEPSSSIDGFLWRAKALATETEPEWTLARATAENTHSISGSRVSRRWRDSDSNSPRSLVGYSMKLGWPRSEQAGLIELLSKHFQSVETVGGWVLAGNESNTEVHQRWAQRLVRSLGVNATSGDIRSAWNKAAAINVEDEFEELLEREERERLAASLGDDLRHHLRSFDFEVDLESYRFREGVPQVPRAIWGSPALVDTSRSF